MKRSALFSIERLVFSAKCLLACLFVLPPMMPTEAQNVGDAFYIYRNDGQFNAFFRDEVDSIAYSYYDADSIYYNDIVTQIIYTQDSIYRIPLAAIDSVGFVQPETIYKENAVPLTGSLYDYLVSSDSLTLTFDSSIPPDLLPKMGDKLVATDLTEKLPLGFTGTVSQVKLTNDSYEVACESLALEEVVDRFYGVVEMTGQQNNGIMRRYLRHKANSEHTYKPFQLVIPTFNQKLDLTPIVRPKKIYDINGKAEVNAAINPVITGKITRVVDNVLNISHYNIHTVADVATVITVEVVGEAINSDNPLNLSSPKTDFSIEGTKPGPWGIPIYYAFGPKFELNGEFAIGTTVYANFRHTEDINFFPLSAIGLVIQGLAPVLNQINTVYGSTSLTHFDMDWAYLAGEISPRIAVVGRLGIGIAAKGHNLGWVGGEAQIGAKAEAELDFDFEALRNAEKGTGFYDGIKDTKVVVMPYWGLEGKLSLFDDRILFTFIGRDDYTFWGKTWQWDFLPKFSDTKATVRNGSNAEVTANITNDSIIPYTVGFSLFDENNNRIGEPQWNNQKFWTHESFSFPFKTTFTDLATEKKYKAYPTLRLFNFNVLASPCADLNMELPVKITNFMQTGSLYWKDGFSHNGRTYSYKYDVAVTVELSDADGVEDWGYAYLDPNGQEALISLKNYASPYTDTRYAYYRDESKSTVTLYEYVRYAGEQDYVYGEPKDYEVKRSLTSCPDDNHPHMIDLGLPSGTKWACCNVGADNPEDFGGYYSWGEIEEKEMYNDVTYLYDIGDDKNGDGWYYLKDGEDSYFLLSDMNICGTNYDVAHVKWGENWQMPSLEQILELLDNCTHKWAGIDDKGSLLTSNTNGNSIFLPSCGWMRESKNGWAYGYGRYWSGTDKGNGDPYAYHIFFANFNSVVNPQAIPNVCYSGNSIRPIWVDQ